MANEITTSLGVQDNGLVNQIEKIRNAMPEIERAAASTGTAVDRLTAQEKAAADARFRNAQAYAQQFNERIQQIERERVGIERLAQAEATRIRAARQAAAGTPAAAPPGRLPGLGISQYGLFGGAAPGAPGLGAAAGIGGPFKEIAQGAEEAGKKIEETTAKVRNLRAGLLLATRLEGLPGLGRGLGLLGGEGALGLVGAAALIEIGNLAVKKSQEIRQQAEADLKAVQEAAAAGLRGGIAQHLDDRSKLQAIIQAAEEARILGRDKGDVAAQREAERQGLRTAYKAPGAFDYIKSLFGYGIGAGFQTPEGTGGTGINSESQAKQQLGYSDQDIRKFAEYYRREGLDDKLASLYGATPHLKNASQEQQANFEKTIDLLHRQFEEGKLGTWTLDQQVNAAKRLTQAIVESSNASERARKAAEQQRHINEQATIAVENLRVGLADNPFERFYLTAQRASEQFLESNRRASRETLEAGQALIEQQKQLNIFREKLGFAGGISDLITEQAKLNAGLGGADLRSQQAAGAGTRASIEQQIYEGRRNGSLTNAQQNALIDQYAATYRQSPLDQINRDATDRTIAIARQALASAKSPLETQAALQFGLQGTQNIGALTSDQVGARQQFLEQMQRIQADVIRAQLEREQREQGSRENFIKALDSFTQALSSGFGIEVSFKADVDGQQAILGTAPGSDTLGSNNGGGVDARNDFRRSGNSLSNNE